MKVRCIARRVAWYNMQRHYPLSAEGKPRAGAEFIVEAQDFSMKCMRLSPKSRFTLDQVLEYQKLYWLQKAKSGEIPVDERGKKKNEAQLAREGIFKEEYVPPQDDGKLEEEDPEEGPRTLTELQKRTEAQKPMEKTVEAVAAMKKAAEKSSKSEKSASLEDVKESLKIAALNFEETSSLSEPSKSKGKGEKESVGSGNKDVI